MGALILNPELGLVTDRLRSRSVNLVGDQPEKRESRLTAWPPAWMLESGVQARMPSEGRGFKSMEERKP